MPSIATMFQRFKYDSRLSSARQLDVMRLASRTTNPSTHGRVDSASLSFTPSLPRSGYVMQTIWPAYDGSVSTSWYPVIDVLKTISPHTSPSAAHARPRNVRPSSSAKSAALLILCISRIQRRRRSLILAQGWSEATTVGLLIQFLFNPERVRCEEVFQGLTPFLLLAPRVLTTFEPKAETSERLRRYPYWLLLINCCASLSQRLLERYLYAGAVFTASMHACIRLVASRLCPNPACARPIK